MVLLHQFSSRCIFKMFVLSVLASVLMHVQLVNSFYIPGVAPTEYKAKEKLDIRVSVTNHLLNVLFLLMHHIKYSSATGC